MIIKIMLRNNVAWDPFRRKRKFDWERRDEGRNTSPSGVTGATGPVSAAELDALLDKVSRYGINSLSPEELARLKQAREEMRR